MFLLTSNTDHVSQHLSSVSEKTDDLWTQCTTESPARSLTVTFQGQPLILSIEIEKIQKTKRVILCYQCAFIIEQQKN